MTEELKRFVTEQTELLVSADTCCQEAKDAAKAWLDALGTPSEAQKTADYIAELEEDIMPIDGLIAFINSDTGKKILGEDEAAKMLVHTNERKAAGEKFCDCPACAACEAILKRKSELL